MCLYGETDIQRCMINYSTISQKVNEGTKQADVPNSSCMGIAYSLGPRTPGSVSSFPIWVVWHPVEQSPLISGHTCSGSPLAHSDLTPMQAKP